VVPAPSDTTPEEISMIHHSEETHQQLVERLPQATGRDLKDWMRALDDGPAFSRFDEKVNWLRDEHGLSHGFATAVVHEADMVRAHRKLG
jgi:hypothetical protein